MKLYQRLASAFVAEGVDTVFGMMGDGNMYWLDALDKLGAKKVEVRHEGVGCGMADGWARVRHTPGVCTTTCGPGVSQIATALITAARAESPLVAFVGESPTNDEEYHQRLDQAKFAAGCETEFIRIANPETADNAVRKAFYRARTESRPVMLSAPMDIQQMNFDDDEPYRPSTTMIPNRVVTPDAAAIEQAADMVAASKNPIVLVGRGATWSGAGEVVKTLASRIGALVATSLLAKGWLAEDEFYVGLSGNYASRTAMEFFNEADCVIAFGASLNRFTTMGYLLYPNAKYVQFDVKPGVMMSGVQGADCYVQSDARAGAQALLDALNKRSVKNVGFRTPDVKKRLAGQYIDNAECLVEPGTVDPREVCLTLDEMIPPNIGMLIGSGSSSGFTTMLCNRPREFQMTGKFYGCIGQMFPVAMGAMLARGNKPMFLVDGDASFMMHLNDFDTAVRCRMPLLSVVLNDQALGSEYHKMKAHHLDEKLSIIPTPDIGAVARGFGGKGALVTSIDALRTAVADWVANPAPMVIDARITRNIQAINMRRRLHAKDD